MVVNTREKVLVLNQDYQAIGLCSAERAFILVYLKKAELIESSDNRVIRSINKHYAFPSIIRLNHYVTVPYRKVSLTRGNIFRRDDYTCAYCGSKSNLTIDHVVPRSLGGKESWENLVTACQECNMQKGNRLPQDANLKLLRPPFRPSFIMYLSNFTGTVRDSWRPYLMF